jgi:hypothetical protein
MPAYGIGQGNKAANEKVDILQIAQQTEIDAQGTQQPGFSPFRGTSGRYLVAATEAHQRRKKKQERKTPIDPSIECQARCDEP